MIAEKINNFIWGNGLIFLLLLTGTLLTLKLGFIQFRLPFLLARQKKSSNNGLSQFKTVCMSLGTSMGTGNIIGAASALAIGGAGSIFWMWISAFLGMALVYGENMLSARYSDENLKGSIAYLSKGLGCPVIAWIFALFCVFSSLGMGGMVQVNTFGNALGEQVNFNRPIAALVIFAIIFVTVSGGGNRISSAAQLLLPAASLGYSVVCIAVIALHSKDLPAVFGRIFSEAFDFSSIAGGMGGYAVSVGIRRGIFSNEAGLGSSPILHSAAESDSTHTQALWSMFEVFFDTIFCCTLTAVMLLCASENFSVTEALSPVLGGFSASFVTAELGIFSFCTVTGWYYCGMTAFKHISGGKYLWLFTIIYSALSACGILSDNDTLWTISDIFNGLMAFVNISALFLLMRKIRNPERDSQNDF